MERIIGHAFNDLDVLIAINQYLNVNAVSGN